MTTTHAASEAAVQAIVDADYPSTGALIRFAVNRATDACAENGWRTTRRAWEVAASTQDEAEDYWTASLREDPERVRFEVAEALASVGWDIHTVWNVLS